MFGGFAFALFWGLVWFEILCLCGFGGLGFGCFGFWCFRFGVFVLVFSFWCFRFMMLLDWPFWLDFGLCFGLYALRVTGLHVLFVC